MGTPEPRVMLLTGAASGIGRHLAGVLARAGDQVNMMVTFVVDD